jgi:hypothetical protein
LPLQSSARTLSFCSLAGVEYPADIDGEDVSDMWLGAKRTHQKLNTDGLLSLVTTQAKKVSE